MFGNFFKSEYAFFMKYFLYFIVLFSIAIYSNLYISSEVKDIKIMYINKACFYMLFIFLMIIINDILDTPIMFLKKFVFIILFALLLVYIVNYLFIKYSKHGFYKTMFHALLGSVGVYILMIISIYYLISTKGEQYSDPIYLQFNYGVYMNLGFLIFTALYFILLRNSEKLLSWNSYLGNLLGPTIFGGLFLFYIFCLIIYFAIKCKFITKIQSLNTFIAITSLIIFFSLIQWYFFISGLQNVCDDKSIEEERKKADITEAFNVGLFLSLLFILWVDDSRKWNPLEYFLYIVVTIFVFLCIFYYSSVYSGISILSLWTFVEWCILTWWNKHDTWNSFNFMLTDQKYNLRKVYKPPQN